MRRMPTWTLVATAVALAAGPTAGLDAPILINASSIAESERLVQLAVAGNPEEPMEWKPTEMPPDLIPDYAHLGRCCQRKTRNGGKLVRWFYHIKEKGFICGDRCKSDVYFCPSKWKGVDNFECNGKEAVNKRGYKENKDWVYCCKRDEKRKYVYFSNGCRERHDKCQNYACDGQEYVDVDADDIKCDKPFKKWVNYNNEYYCKKKVHHGFSNRDCAGFTVGCENSYCIMHSQGPKYDCINYCPGYSSSDEGTADTPDKYAPPRTGGGVMGMVKFMIVLLVMIGGLGYGALHFAKQHVAGMEDEPGSGASGGKGKGKGEGPGIELSSMQAPPGGYGGAPQGGAPGYGGAPSYGGAAGYGGGPGYGGPVAFSTPGAGVYL